MPKWRCRVVVTSRRAVDVEVEVDGNDFAEVNRKAIAAADAVPIAQWEHDDREKIEVKGKPDA